MSVTAIKSDVAVRTKLRPLEAFFEQDDVTEISINQPKEVWIARQGQPYMQREDVPELDFGHLNTLADLVAQYSDQEVDAEHPLLSGKLPNGYRVQVIKTPAVESGLMALSIRKPAILDVDLDWYEDNQAFRYVNKRRTTEADVERSLLAAYREARYKDFIVQAVRGRKNIIVSAGTDTGKTTFLNAALKAVDERERIVTIEDTREIRLKQPNALHLLASRGGQGLSKATQEDLLRACLRLRPNRIVMGEIRGAYLNVVNSGHPGSLTTIHADSVELAWERLALMVMEARTPMTKSEVKDYLRLVVPIIVQWNKDDAGERFITEIYFDGAARS
jgi:type IV secretion system protein VirB11